MLKCGSEVVDEVEFAAVGGGQVELSSGDEPPQLFLDDPAEWLSQFPCHPKVSQGIVANELDAVGLLPHGVGPIRIVPTMRSFSCRENASHIASL